ncbi:MAG: sugar ABC transporter substrate-binding protein [Devosia sp.]|nr:sugar ABC transporter substrate-binding protein [Devosia sp.]
MTRKIQKIGRRTVVVSGLAVMAAAALGAGASAQDAGLGTAEHPVEIRVSANESFANQMQTLVVPEFNKVYPNIKVTVDSVPFVEYLAKAMLDITSPSPLYDVAIVDEKWVPQLASTGGLADLKSGDIAAWTDVGYDWDDFYQAALSSGEWSGVQYGVPLRSNLLLMFYNKTLFEKAGLPAPTPELTWTEYLEQLPKLVQDTNGDGQVDAWGIDTYFIREPNTPAIWQAILSGNGGRFFDENAQPAFNNEAGISALETHKKLLDYAPPGALSHGFTESLQAFRQGQVATLFNWVSVYKGTAIDAATTTLKPEEVGVQALPVGSVSGGTYRGVWNGTVPANSQNKQAAWAFLQWLSSKEGEQFYANELGIAPARQSTLNSTPKYDWLVPVFTAMRQGFEVAAQGEMWTLRHPRSDAALQVITDETARALANEIPVAEALQIAADRIPEALQ